MPGCCVEGLPPIRRNRGSGNVMSLLAIGRVHFRSVVFNRRGSVAWRLLYAFIKRACLVRLKPQRPVNISRRIDPGTSISLIISSTISAGRASKGKPAVWLVG